MDVLLKKTIMNKNDGDTDNGYYINTDISIFKRNSSKEVHKRILC